MIQEAITQKLLIERMGEKQHFQITLPRDTRRIIGLEYGTLEKDGNSVPSAIPVPAISDYFKVSPSKVIGRLSLRSSGAEGFFYQADLTEDRNANLHEVPIGVLWQPRAWTHGRKWEEISFNISTHIRLIEGLFEDSYGIGEYNNFTYQLGLYLWIEKCSV